MLSHLKAHWRSWLTGLICCVFAFAVVFFSDAFQQCMNKSYYESSDYEPEKGFALIFSTLGWTKTCAGEFLKIDGEAITAFFTLVVGLFTAALWTSTDKLWRSGERQIQTSRQVAAIQARQTRVSNREAARAAEAARLNAQALIDSERAHLYAVIKTENLRAALHSAIHYNNSPGMDLMEVSERPAVELALKNLGRTPAILLELSFQLIQGTPDQRVFEHVMAVVVDPVIDGEAETATAIPCRLEGVFTVGDAKAAFTSKRPLYFYGSATYATAFDRVYVYRWRYENTGARWLLTNYEDRDRGKP